MRSRTWVQGLGAIGLVLAWVGYAQAAPFAQLVSRPLTPQDIKDFSLPAGTQKSGGLTAVGLGTPAYLEVQVNADIVVSSVNWSLQSRPPLSAAEITESPVPLSAPIYDGGQRQKYTVAARKLLVPDLVGQYAVRAEVLGTTTSGAPASVVANLTITGGRYMGVMSACGFCHGGGIEPDLVTPWMDTGHADFFALAIDGYKSDHYASYCISCHTVGYDTNALAVNGGFDDVARTVGWTFPAHPGPGVWDAMHPDLQNKGNIQCENCHGPAEQHNGDTNKIAISLSAGNCAQCHDSLNQHWHNVEWERSMHSTGYVFRATGACAPCHSAIGFIDAHDGDGKGSRGTGDEGITCQACHDPHSDENPDQLRTLDDVKLGDSADATPVAVITTGGKGKLCMQCHKSRRTAETYATQYRSNYGPHHSVQTDMLAGKNAIEYGGISVAAPQNPHMNVPDTCVTCHMTVLRNDPNPAYSNAFTHAGGHTWKMEAPDGTDITKGCLPCHVTSEFDFTYRGEDYDGDGNVEGVQSEVEGLLETLGNLLPPDGPSVTVTSAYTVKQLRAAYNYLYVEEDGSHGVHNPRYAVALLKASIADLQAPPSNGWDQAADLGGGWRNLPWFGTYKVDAWPWIWHTEHGWLYVVSTDTASIWLWDTRLGWLFTTQSSYPFMYSVGQNSWMWYVRGGTPGGRSFYNYATATWISNQ
jgi:hypothetical protein